MSLLSAGEDGFVKLWSKNGSIRSSIMSCSHPIYQATFSPNNDKVIIASGRSIIIKPIESTQKPIQWDAHQELILALDWNAVNNCIVSGGEDCKYCLWDAFGKPLYSSRAFDNVITAVAFSPNGEYIAVGSYNTILLTDKRGWIYYNGKVDSGSLYSLAWSLDGTQLAGAGGAGNVLFAGLTGRQYETDQYQVTVTDHSKLHVRNIAKDYYEDLHVGKDRVVEVSINDEWLVVATASQCYIYNLSNLNTPYIMDLKASPFLILMCKTNFLVADKVDGIHVISYEGKVLCNPKHVSFRPELFSEHMIGLSSGRLAVVDSSDRKTVYLLETAAGKEQARYVHSQEITSVHLFESLNSFIDPNLAIVAVHDLSKDLYLVSINLKAAKGQNATSSLKLQSNVDSYRLNPRDNSLVAVGDGVIKLWHYPTAAFVDKDLLQVTVTLIDVSQASRDYRITEYTGSRIHIRKQDGSVDYHMVPAYFSLLFSLCSEGKWGEAVALCRSVRQPTLWGTLAAVSYSKKQYATAEIAFCEVSDIAKVCIYVLILVSKYLCYIILLLLYVSRLSMSGRSRLQPHQVVPARGGWPSNGGKLAICIVLFSTSI